MIKCVDCVGLSDIKRFSLHAYIFYVMVPIFSINNVALLLLTPSPSTLTQKFDASQVGLAWAVSVSVTVPTVRTVLSTVGGCPSGCAPGFTGEDCAGG